MLDCGSCCVEGMLRNWLVGLLLILSLTAIIPSSGATCACVPGDALCRVAWRPLDSLRFAWTEPTLHLMCADGDSLARSSSAAAAHGDEAKNNENAASYLRPNRLLIQEQPTADDGDKRYDVLIDRCMRTAEDANSNMPRCISQTGRKKTPE